MAGKSPTRMRRQAPLYVACYAIWAALSLLALWVALQVRLNLIALVFFIVGRTASPNDTTGAAGRMLALDGWITIFLVLAWLAVVAALEHYLRTGVERDRLWARAARVAIVLVVMLGVSYGLRALA